MGTSPAAACQAKSVRMCQANTASGVLPQCGVIGEKVALDGNSRAISGERTYLSGSLDWHDSRYAAEPVQTTERKMAIGTIVHK